MLGGDESGEESWGYRVLWWMISYMLPCIGAQIEAREGTGVCNSLGSDMDERTSPVPE
mgnify:CR=1 FL=1